MMDKLSENTWRSWQSYRLNIDEKTKFRIKALSERAENSFRVYRKACEEIEQLLSKRLLKDYILDVMYQPSDGIVAAVDNGFTVPDNIPIGQFLEG